MTFTFLLSLPLAMTMSISLALLMLVVGLQLMMPLVLFLKVDGGSLSMRNLVGRANVNWNHLRELTSGNMMM